MDQALLRLKRKYDEDPIDYVFITVTSPSIARILSVWKHYHEFGNVLAVNPHFVIKDGNLTLKDSPLEKKGDLFDIGEYAAHLRRYDLWFKQYLTVAPYSYDLLRDLNRVRFVLHSWLKELENRIGTALPMIDVDK